jgi:hypothetical protein
MSESQQAPRPDRKAVLTKALLKAAALIGINDAELAKPLKRARLPSLECTAVVAPFLKRLKSGNSAHFSFDCSGA